MDIAEPTPKTNLTLTPIGQAFAVVAANQVFKNMAAATAEMPLSQCKDKAMPFLLNLTTQTQAFKMQLGTTEKERSAILRELSQNHTALLFLCTQLHLEGLSLSCQIQEVRHRLVLALR